MYVWIFKYVLHMKKRYTYRFNKCMNVMVQDERKVPVHLRK